MIAIPLILIVFALLFPRFTRFMFGLAFFAVLFVVASVIDHAHAGGINPDIETSFQNCMNSNAVSHRSDLFQLRSMGGNDILVLAGSCQALLDNYMHACQQIRSTDKCFVDVKLMSYKAMQDSMN